MAIFPNLQETQKKKKVASKEVEDWQKMAMVHDLQQTLRGQTCNKWDILSGSY